MADVVAPSSDMVVVHRVSTVCTHPGALERPDLLRDGVESAVHELAATVGAIAAASAASEGTEILVVRRVEIDVQIGADWRSGTIAAAWSDAARAATARALASTDGSVIRFADRAAYLGSYLVDRVSGEATERWYYRPFDGLRPMPVTAAIRTALLGEPQLGLQALGGLARSDRDRVLDALGDHEALRVLDGLAGAGGGREALSEAVVAARRAIGPADGPRDARGALRMYVDTAAAEPGLAGPVLRTAVLALFALGRIMDVGAARDAFRSGDLSVIGRVAGVGAAARLRPLLEDVAVNRDALLRQAEPATAPSDSTSGGRWTRHGGAFLLAPFADARARGVAARLEVPAVGEMDGASALAFLLTVRALGTEHAASSVRDPVVRELFAVPSSVGTVEVALWSRELSRRLPGPWMDATESGASRQDADAVAEPRLVLVVPSRVAASGPAGALLVDAANHAWLAFGAACDERLWRGVDDPRTTVLADGRLFDVAREHITRARVERMGAAPDMASGSEATEDTWVQRAARLREDVAGLRVPRELAGPPVVERWLVREVRAVLSSFSADLRGFEGSSVGYLRRNFLDLDANVYPESGRWVVRVGMPPLNLVLSMSGLASREYALASAPARLVAVYQ